jgi:hypothetical protein
MGDLLRRRGRMWEGLQARWLPACMAIALLGACVEPLPPDAAQPATLAGSPLRLQDGTDRIVLLLEYDVVHWSYGRRSASKVSSNIPHVELWAYAATVPTRPLWRRRFAETRPGIMTSASDYLVYSGDRLHVGLAEPVAVSAVDGGDPQPMPPPETGVRGTSVHEAREVQGRGRWGDGTWVGLLGEAERERMTRAGRDAPWGPGIADALGDDLDYTLWTAQVRDVSAAPADWPAGFPDNWGRRPAYSQLQRLADAPAFHRAGVLRTGDRGEPVPVPGSDDLLVLHAPVADGPARLVIARVDSGTGGVQWEAALPAGRIAHLLPGGDVLAIVGDRPVTKTGSDYEPPTQWLFVLDLRDGRSDEVDLADVRLDGLPEPLR